MNDQTETTWEMSRSALTFGFIGGAIVWGVHFLLIYAIAEFGCVGDAQVRSFLGLSAVTWWLFAATVGTLPVAVAAAWVSYRSERGLLAAGRNVPGHSESRIHLARTGWMINCVFIFIMLAQTIPIFYFLHDC